MEAIVVVIIVSTLAIELLILVLILVLVFLVHPIAEYGVVEVVDVGLVGVELEQLDVVEPLLLAVAHESRVLVELSVGSNPNAAASVHVVVEVMVVGHVHVPQEATRLVVEEPVHLILMVELLVVPEEGLVVVVVVVEFVVLVPQHVHVHVVLLHRLVVVAIGWYQRVTRSHEWETHTRI